MPKPVLGPNHPDYGKPVGPKTYPRRQPEASETTTYTPTQLLVLYAGQHDRQRGGTCPCILCADLRLHLAQARAKRKGGRR